MEFGFCNSLEPKKPDILHDSYDNLFLMGSDMEHVIRGVGMLNYLIKTRTRFFLPIILTICCS